jgi:hypothetical protein
MPLLEQIKDYASTIGAEIKEKKGTPELSLIIAERKGFLTRKKLLYLARFKIDDEVRVLKFSEMLKEYGAGLSTGGGLDDGAASGFGFKKEVYKSGGRREGTIEEQSRLFGKDYSYQFEFQTIRENVKTLAQSSGYEFKYQIIPLGL